MSALSIADVLERAADLIEPEGAWTQYDYCDGPTGGAQAEDFPTATCFCAVGAIACVMGWTGPQAETWTEQQGIDDLIRRLRPNARGLIGFNDEDADCSGDVVTVFRDAAMFLRAEDI